MNLFRSDLPGWLHPNEVSSVERICDLIPVGKNIVEIGAFAGRTTYVIAEKCPHANIYAIDPWQKSDTPQDLSNAGMPFYTGDPNVTANDAEQIFMQEIAAKYSHVKPIKGRFPKDFPHDLSNIGLIYWDTDAPVCRDPYRIYRELFNAYRKLDVGGILAGHSFAEWMPKAVNAIRGLALRMGEDIILPPSGSIWYMHRTR